MTSRSTFHDTADAPGGRQAAQSRAVDDVNAALHDGVDRDGVLRLVARGVRQVLGASACTVMTLEPGETLLVRAADGRVRPDLPGSHVPVDDTLEGEVVRSQAPVTSADGQDPRWRGTSLSGPGLGSVLLVPVPGYDRPGGVIEVADAEGRHFGTDDARTVGLFAAQVGMAVEHDRAGADLELLAAVLGRPDTEPLPRTLEALTTGVLAGTEALACAIYLLDDNLSLRQVAGDGPRELIETGMTGSGPNVAHAAIASRAPIVHQHVLPGELPGAGRRSSRRLEGSGRTASLVCVPLMSRSVVLGVLCCHCPPGRYPSKLELAYLSVVAGKAAMAVDSSHLVASAQEKAAQEERQRLARELHDSVSQALYGIALGARTARESLGEAPEERVDQPLGYVLALAEAGLADMHALIFELRPQALAEEGLVAALHKQLAAFRARHGVDTHAELGPEPAGAFKVKQALYRIAQEALQNAAKHAQARRIVVRLETSPTALALEIADDGDGFDPSASFPGHLGLRSMRERITEVGGVLDLSSAPGEGTQIRARVPTGLWP